MKQYLVTASKTHHGPGTPATTAEFDDIEQASAFANAELTDSPLVIVMNRQSGVSTHLRNKMSKS